MQREDYAWAAGLFEGEGSFCLASARRTQPNATLSMCDEGTVKRFHEVIGCGQFYGPWQNKGKGQNGAPYWRWSATSYENVQAALAMMWPWLSPRRRARGAEVLSG